MSFHCLWESIVSDEKSAKSYIKCFPEREEGLFIFLLLSHCLWLLTVELKCICLWISSCFSCLGANRTSWICELNLSIISPLSETTIACTVTCLMLTHRSLRLCSILFSPYYPIWVITTDLFSNVHFCFLLSEIWHFSFVVVWMWRISPPPLEDIGIKVLISQPAGLLRGAWIVKCWNHQWVNLLTSSYHMG